MPTFQDQKDADINAVQIEWNSLRTIGISEVERYTNLVKLGHSWEVKYECVSFLILETWYKNSKEKS